MQAIILAAGMGKRLKDLTKDNTKCMVKVNGVTLIERLLKQLDIYSLNRIVIVIGYQGKKLVEYINTLKVTTPVEFVENPIFDKTNNIYSLALAKQYLLTDDTLLFESDVIVEDCIIKSLLDDRRDTLALVDKYESWMDGTCVKLSDNDDISEFIPGKKFKFDEIKSYYKTVNIYKFGKHFSLTHYVPFLEAYSNAMGNNEYYEQVLKILTLLDDPGIKAKRLNGEKWYEIDDIQDLDIAESIFANDKKIDKIQSRYGGYWRYPKILDFCYLVNPYFPPQRLIDEIKANFETLLTQYPSGMKVNSLLAAKNFGVCRENIVVGNGAAELIKSVMSTLNGNVGIIKPTFEEYSNRYEKDKQIVFTSDNSDFSYTGQDIIDYFDDKKIGSLVLINPDNPSGNFISREDLERVVDWAKRRNIFFIIDESFVDFADESYTLIEQSFLDNNAHVAVVKSISKSFGVPGIRLGVLASGDRDLIDFIKRDVGIWNINSYGEFYLQIEEKYKKDYVEAIKLFKEERRHFKKKLERMSGIRVINSQANYFMIELKNGITAKGLTERLFNEHRIFIKDLSGKIGCGEYVRIAIRNKEDNDKLIRALSEITGERF